MRFSNEGQALTVSLQLSQAPSSQATTALTHELIKHFLFVRNQIPGLFSDLEQQVRESAQVLSKHTVIAQQLVACEFKLCSPHVSQDPSVKLVCSTGLLHQSRLLAC